MRFILRAWKRRGLLETLGFGLGGSLLVIYMVVHHNPTSQLQPPHPAVNASVPQPCAVALDRDDQAQFLQHYGAALRNHGSEIYELPIVQPPGSTYDNMVVRYDRKACRFEVLVAVPFFQGPFPQYDVKTGAHGNAPQFLPFRSQATVSATQVGIIIDPNSVQLWDGYPQSRYVSVTPPIITQGPDGTVVTLSNGYLLPLSS